MEHFHKDVPHYVTKMIQLQQQGKLQTFVDMGEKYEKGPFKGLESIADAVEVSAIFFYFMSDSTLLSLKMFFFNVTKFYNERIFMTL